MRGLRAFLAAGHADEALRIGWSHDELFRVPPLWSRIELCGVGLLIGDREVIGVTPTAIQIKTSSGAIQSFYRKPAIDYRLIFETRLKLIRGNYAGDSEEPRLRAIEHTVNVHRSNNGCDLETAKAAVMAALKGGATP
jgi:hypothetical protein